MAKRLSNRDRIQRKALEAAKEEEEKKEAATAPKAKAKAKKKRVTKKKDPAEGSPTRMKIVWKVFSPMSKEVATFPYPDKAKAEKKAADLSKKLSLIHI